MCGICGIIRLDNSAPIAGETLLGMRETLLHRGPDDAGVYLDEKAGLASQRLAILDLSSQGHMPMCSADGRYVIVYNGEVYNYQALRASLEQKGYGFHSETDTEVLLNLFIDQGPAMLSQCNGMFAFAIWDAREQTLFAARDRMGIKPFYYTANKGSFYFASEEKALFAAGVPAMFDKTTWEELLFFRYVSGERTPYEDIRRLLPGHYLLIKNGSIRTYCWWALSDVSKNSEESKSQFPPNPVTDFQEFFDESVQLRRISDVPVGVLLSGGLDSSGVAAMVASQAGSNVDSFTVRFSEAGYDEGFWAKEVAQQWRLNYRELYASPQEVPMLLEEATWFLDEPLAHGNDIHLLAIARYAKPQVTVLLSGEGADELMGGYGRYRIFLYSWLLQAMGGISKVFNPFMPAGGSLQRATQILAFPALHEKILFSSAGVFPFETPFVKRTGSGFEYRREMVKQASSIYSEPVRQAMYYDQHTYLQSLLDRNDRMTMGASIECRVPYLDHRMIEWLVKMPTPTFFDRGRGKMLLRRAMREQLPSTILQHKKWGFTVPWPRYLREIPALRGWIQKLPQAEILQSAPLEQTKLQEIINNFLSGDDHSTSLIRQLAFIALWEAVCIQKRRQVLD